MQVGGAWLGLNAGLVIELERQGGAGGCAVQWKDKVAESTLGLGGKNKKGRYGLELGGSRQEWLDKRKGETWRCT